MALDKLALTKLLEATPFSGEGVIDLLSADSQLQELFAQDSGVFENYTIREHTLRVYDVFNEQLPHFQSALENIVSIDVIRLLKFTLALHDIGKPIAIRERGKKFQHEFTVPILKEHMRQAGFEPKDLLAAEALMGHDELGRFIKGRSSVEQAAEQLRTLSEQSGLGLVDFFASQLFYYTVDAGSYKFLRQSVFEERRGRLHPRAPHFAALVSHLGITLHP